MVSVVKTVGVVVVTVVVKVVEKTLVTGGTVIYELQNANAELRAFGRTVSALSSRLSTLQTRLEAFVAATDVVVARVVVAASGPADTDDAVYKAPMVKIKVNDLMVTRRLMFHNVRVRGQSCNH